MLRQIAVLAPDQQPFNVVTLTNVKGMQISLMDWGATWVSCKMVLVNGSLQEVLLGCDSPVHYLKQKAYLGATIGRYANRIRNSEISYGQYSYQLHANEGVNQFNGGPKGFSERRWTIVNHSNQHVEFGIYSPDGDQGYPGNMKATVTYALTDSNEVEIVYRAIVDEVCPVCLSNRAYFNLDGVGTADARNQELLINADYVLPVNAERIPIIGLKAVQKSPTMDFRYGKPVIKDFLKDSDQKFVGGYEHSYLLHNECAEGQKPAAYLVSSDGQRQLIVYTTQPAIHFYSGNFLAGTPARGGKIYNNYAGIVLEPQMLPDSPNHPEWPQPDCWLKPGEKYYAKTSYKFLTI